MPQVGNIPNQTHHDSSDSNPTATTTPPHCHPHQAGELDGIGLQRAEITAHGHKQPPVRDRRGTIGARCIWTPTRQLVLLLAGPVYSGATQADTFTSLGKPVSFAGQRGETVKLVQFRPGAVAEAGHWMPSPCATPPQAIFTEASLASWLHHETGTRASPRSSTAPTRVAHLHRMRHPPHHSAFTSREGSTEDERCARKPIKRSLGRGSLRS